MLQRPDPTDPLLAGRLRSQRQSSDADVEFSSQFGKSLIASLVGGGGSISLFGLVTPLGWIARMGGLAFYGGASTYAIGRVFIQDLESGGTFLSLDPAKVKSYYAEQFEAGKSEVKKSFAGIKP